MFIDCISLENVRTFAAQKTVTFNHPDRVYSDDSHANQSLRQPQLKNVNLLFGENASGKTTLLEAIALASLGPAISDSRISPRPLIRFLPRIREPSHREMRKQAIICASLVLHGSEILSLRPGDANQIAESKLTVTQKGELERFESVGSANANWESIYRSDNESFFVVAYGATRRVEQKPDQIFLKCLPSSFVRVNRIESIVQEGYPLYPLQAWFPQMKPNSNRCKKIIELINGALGGGHFTFEGRRAEDDTKDYLFTRGGLDIPYRSLSDGYRAFLGWVADLLFHLDFACRNSDLDLDEISGVVLVDEIDLHLHPKWQMDVIGNISKTFPRLQFIFTSHSPLIAGSVEWMNITHLHLDKQHRTGVDVFEQSIHGLDADQILVSDLFGLESTRAKPKQKRLHELNIRARRGDEDAARELISELAKGLEDEK